LASTRPDGQGGDEGAGIGIHHSHLLVVTASEEARFFLSMARPEGLSQPVSFQRCVSFRAWGSNSTISLLSSLFGVHAPLAVGDGEFGLPPRGMVPATFSCGDVDGGRVLPAPVEGKHPFRKRIIDDGVGSVANFDAGGFVEVLSIKKP